MTGFGREKRIRSGDDFRRIFDQGCRASDEVLMVVGLPNAEGVTRLGLSVSKKHGSAVKRNRRKRLLREAFRLSYTELPAAIDFVVVPRLSDHPTLIAYQSSLTRLAALVQKKLRRQTGDERVQPRSSS